MRALYSIKFFKKIFNNYVLFKTIMVNIYGILEKYFLGAYEEFPLEIKKKMRNLLIINLLNVFGWIFIFAISGLASYIEKPDFLTIFRDFIVLALIALALLLIRIKRPIIAGYTTIFIVIVIALHPILNDMFSIYSSSEDMLYKTLGYLILGELLLGAYTIKRAQILVYTILSIILLIVHFLVLMEIFKGGLISNESYAMFFESLFLFIISSSLTFILFNLTLQSRIEMIRNIIFYKMTEKGPVSLFSEHYINYNLMLESGIYFYTAIGQGIRYRTGLFGPLPFGEETGRVSLIYSAIVDDSDFEGSRLKGKNYILIAFLGKGNEIDLIEKHRLIEKVEEEMKNLPDLAEFEEEDFQAFVSSIRAR